MRFFLLAACAAITCGVVLAQEAADPVVITVGSEKITRPGARNWQGNWPS
jgi:hypothetical protein